MINELISICNNLPYVKKVVTKNPDVRKGYDATRQLADRILETNINSGASRDGFFLALRYSLIKIDVLDRYKEGEVTPYHQGIKLFYELHPEKDMSVRSLYRSSRRQI